MRHNGKLYTLIRSKVWITENEMLNLSTPSRNERIWIIRKNRIMEIYVGNLPWSTSDQELADAFGAYGNVEKASIISDRHSGRSKGFGFVTMNDADEANKAIEAMNGTDMGGRSLKVNEARPREDRPPRQSDW
jgi:RNA recognition motif-containing protein